MNQKQIKDMLTIVNNRKFNDQLEQAIEEASEFILAAQKYKRYPDSKKAEQNLIEETADILIMMEQMRAYLNVIKVDGMIDYKLERQLARMCGLQPNNCIYNKSSHCGYPIDDCKNCPINPESDDSFFSKSKASIGKGGF